MPETTAELSTIEMVKLLRSCCSGGLIEAAANRLEALEAQVGRLREALEPFAIAADRYSNSLDVVTGNDVGLWQLPNAKSGMLTVGDLRDAEAAMLSAVPASQLPPMGGEDWFQRAVDAEEVIRDIVDAHYGIDGTASTRARTIDTARQLIDQLPSRKS